MMTKAKAKNRGFILTLIFSMFHIIFVNSVAIQNSPTFKNTSDFQSSLLSDYWDLSFFIGVLLAWILGRKYGIDYFIYKKQSFGVHYNLLFKVGAIANALVIVFYIMYEAIIQNHLGELKFLIDISFLALIWNGLVGVMSALIFRLFVVSFYPK